MDKFLPVMEYDPNRAKIYDVISAPYAETLEIGGEIFAVAVDYVDVPTDDIEEAEQPEWKVLSAGTGILCRVTEKKPVGDDLVLVYAEPIQ